jgi:hypothetical protein
LLSRPNLYAKDVPKRPGPIMATLVVSKLEVIINYALYHSFKVLL